MENIFKMKDIKSFNKKHEPHGYWERYYSDGTIWSKTNYVNGKQHGYCEKYWYDGKLWYKGNYLNGMQDGYWEIYDSYVEDEPQIYKGNYFNGKRTGLWEYYDNDGILIRQIFFA